MVIVSAEFLKQVRNSVVNGGIMIRFVFIAHRQWNITVQTKPFLVDFLKPAAFNHFY